MAFSVTRMLNVVCVAMLLASQAYAAPVVMENGQAGLVARGNAGDAAARDALPDFARRDMGVTAGKLRAQRRKVHEEPTWEPYTVLIPKTDEQGSTKSETTTKYRTRTRTRTYITTYTPTTTSNSAWTRTATLAQTITLEGEGGSVAAAMPTAVADGTGSGLSGTDTGLSLIHI